MGNPQRCENNIPKTLVRNKKMEDKEEEEGVEEKEQKGENPSHQVLLV